ncbi:7543_t:CDS:2 [Entrophospora sp. SA101]|nr:17046_t:CDS:2 [Entrophospora sp. SA101]CAJ0908774.1 7543_t:CDS:2 [Entrophospora sp. SA101]
MKIYRKSSIAKKQHHSSGKADMQYFQPKIQEDINDPVPKLAALVGVSGCGKTATIFDAGQHNFITYIVTPHQNSQPLYSQDFHQLLNDINAILPQGTSQLSFNTEHDVITYILEQQGCENCIKPYIKAFLIARKFTWSILEDSKFGHFFHTVYEAIKEITDYDDVNLLDTYYRKLEAHFEKITNDTTRFTIAIDECHCLQRYFCRIFLPKSTQQKQEFECHSTLEQKLVLPIMLWSMLMSSVYSSCYGYQHGTQRS